MQIEIVDTVEHRYVHSVKAPDGATIAELVPGRSMCTFVLKMPDGETVLAEVTEEAFLKYRSHI